MFLCFRYLSHLLKEKKIDRMPKLCKDWIEISTPTRVACIHPRCLSQWEFAKCPWWLDLTHGVRFSHKGNGFVHSGLQDETEGQ